MEKKVLRARVEGKIIWPDVVALGKAVSYFEGCEIKVTLEKQIYKRTTPQNAYFHVAHLPIIHDNLVHSHGWDNWDISQTKALLKDMFLREEISPGKFITRGTSDLNRAEFSVFLEKCSLFCWHEFKVMIPPASVYKINLEAKTVKIAA